MHRRQLWLLLGLLALLPTARWLVVEWGLWEAEKLAQELLTLTSAPPKPAPVADGASPMCGAGGAGAFAAEEEDFALLGVWRTPSVDQAASQTGRQPRQHKMILAPPPAGNARLSANAVLDLAQSDAAPRGVSREAGWGMPAGIEILNAGHLGIGWAPGDRLVAVNGQALADRGAVVTAVLEARAQLAPAIRATVARRTAQGIATYEVVVEQPYTQADVLP